MCARQGGSKLAGWGSKLAKGGSKLTEGGSEFATLPLRVCYPLRIHTEYHRRIPRRNLETSKRGVRRAWPLKDTDHAAGEVFLLLSTLPAPKAAGAASAEPPRQRTRPADLAARRDSMGARYRGLPPPAGMVAYPRPHKGAVGPFFGGCCAVGVSGGGALHR